MFGLEKKDKANIFIKENFLTDCRSKAVALLFSLLIVHDVILDDVSTVCMCTSI